LSLLVQTEQGFAFELGPNTVLGGRPEIDRLIAGSGLSERLLAAWQSFPVPLNVVLNREIEADGREKFWAV
jgi:hypothetical protein